MQFGPPITPTDVKAGEGFVGNGLPEKDVFYYHPDHLGSSSYISTLNGQISQHVEYIAFGEVLFEEHSSSFKSPYLFNGKELDRETNLTNFGARYLDMKTSLWLNVDPLVEKYPGYSPYVYCINNPLNVIDPDGRAPTDWFVNFKTGKVVHVEGQSKLTQATATSIGAGDAKNYSRLGADNMFGNNKAANNIRELGASVVENPENFMNKQGYNKAENVKIKEREYVSGGKVGEENISLPHNTLDQIGDNKITYAKPEQLNSKANIEVKSSSSTYSSIETTSYNLTKPYGQSNQETSVYGSKETGSKILGPLQIVGDLIQKCFEK
ncbi:RHS repeat-associated core domain-containing protein [Flavobacterium psychrophilum]|nr:RHS repeat-associated core domain-containing protein [Flavobacterium psychrophilum]